MITRQTLAQARAAARDLAAAGNIEAARAVETLIAEVADASVPALEVMTAPQAGELLGVTGQTVKNWVRAGKLPGYRIGGRIMISRAALEIYVQRAQTALDLADLPDEEIASLIAEERSGA